MPATRRPKSPRLKLEITSELIQDAVPRDSSHCLWAEAVKAAFPDASRISVDLQTIRFTDPKKGLRHTYLTPRTCQIALVQFDQGILPEPHSVVLRAGQVTVSGRQSAFKQTVTEAGIEQRKAASKKGQAVQHRQSLSKTTLRQRGGGGVPDRTGGKPPPLAAGKRRAFGLRGLEY